MVTTKLYFGVGDAKPTAKGLSRKHVVEGIQVGTLTPCAGQQGQLRADQSACGCCRRL